MKNDTDTRKSSVRNSFIPQNCINQFSQKTDEKNK